jgi:hypothetical protein
METTTLINYGGESRELKITTEALFLFNQGGYAIGDFSDPKKQFIAQVALIGACLDPDADLRAVARKCPGFAEADRVLGLAFERDLGLELDGGETPRGNVPGSPDKESSEPSPDSSSDSSHKPLKPPAP